MICDSDIELILSTFQIIFLVFKTQKLLTTFKSLLHTDGVCVPCSGPTAFLNDQGICTCEVNHLIYMEEECIPCDSTNGVLSADGECECVDPETMLLSDDTNLCIPCSADFGIQVSVFSFKPMTVTH